MGKKWSKAQHEKFSKTMKERKARGGSKAVTSIPLEAIPDRVPSIPRMHREGKRPTAQEQLAFLFIQTLQAILKG